MAEPRPILPLANEETACLRWFEAFIRRRVELEEQMISGLQELLKEAPPLPERNLLWHCALEKLLDGTREELHARVEELGRLKDQIQTVGISVAKAETYIRDLSIEFEKLESAESVHSAQTAATASHNNWFAIKSVDVSVQKSLYWFFSSSQAQKEKLEKEKARKSFKAFQELYSEDLKYRRNVHKQRQRQRRFLNSIPDRIQEYGTNYWTAVHDVGIVMESFANYLRNISSTCNSHGSALWALTKNTKPLVDASYHTEAIESACHQSPSQFSPIYYQSPGSKSRSYRDQTILFGCPMELRTVGELKNVPPILEYLLNSFQDEHMPPSRNYISDRCWTTVNEIEQAWTGVEERDRAIISNLDLGDCKSLIEIYFRSLPKPVLSKDDTAALYEIYDPTKPINLAPSDDRTVAESSRLLWSTWSKDPIKAAVLGAMVSVQIRLGPAWSFGWGISGALVQESRNSSSIATFLAFLSRNPNAWRARTY